MKQKSDFIRLLEIKHGPLEKCIATLLDKHQGSQVAVAEELSVSTAFISRWLKDNGYVRVVRYEKEV